MKLFGAVSAAARHSLSYVARTRLRIFLSILTVLLVPYLVLVLLLPKPQMISTLSAVSERVSVRVVDQRQASFVVGQVKLYSEQKYPDGKCVAGLVRPRRGVTVIYARLWKADRIRIELRPPEDDETADSAELLTSADPATAELLRGTVVFQPAIDEDPQAMGCNDGAPISRLPIHGIIRVGEEQQPPDRPRQLVPSLLHSGTLAVAAEAVEFSLFGIHLVRPTVYSVATINLPVGGRLESSNAANPDSSSFWWGFVQADRDETALSVNAATESPSFAIFRPGVSKPIKVEVGVLVQLFNDPNLSRLQLIVTALVIIVQLSIPVAEFIFTSKRGTHASRKQTPLSASKLDSTSVRDGRPGGPPAPDPPKA